VITATDRGMSGTSNRWRGRLHLLETWHDRLSRVQLDNRDALDVIKYWDTDNTVFYLDPPYVVSTRKRKKVYDYETDDNHHEKLIDILLKIKGQAVLSGYDTPLYQRLLESGWKKIEFETACHAAGRIRISKLQDAGSALKRVPRTEVLWILNKKQKDQDALF